MMATNADIPSDVDLLGKLATKRGQPRNKSS